MRYHEDERASRYCDLFWGLPGDVNLFLLKPGQISAWHRHMFQTDQFVLVNGSVRFGVCPEGNTPKFKEMGGFDLIKGGSRVIIAPGVWHGYQNTGKDEALLLMYLSHKYEDGWDEERRTLEEMPWNP